VDLNGRSSVRIEGELTSKRGGDRNLALNGCGSAGKERQTHGAIRIVDIRIDNHYRLPGAKHHSSAVDRNGDRRRNEGWKHMVASVTGGSMLMAPSGRFGRKEPVDCVQNVVVATGTRLENGDSGRCVWNEHRNEPVTFRATKPCHFGSDIRRGGPVPSGQLE